MILKVGKQITINELIAFLVDNGYEKTHSPALIYPGEFNQVGDVVRIYPINETGPIIVYFFDVNVEKISVINSKVSHSTFEILPNVLRIDGKKIYPGDYVVHEDHGIGMFSRVGLKKVNGINKVYIYLDYLNNDSLFVPINLVDKISSYIGVGKRRPKLNKLGTGSWRNNKKKIYESMVVLARELLSIYARREINKKNAYKLDQKWKKEIVGTFDFVETNDQQAALREVYLDLEKQRPMDRLICGDVGFGKTEVAIRAATQAIANGFQVVLLCPTTILAEQHFATMQRRFKNLPIKIDLMSRFRSKKQQQETAKEVEHGSIDFVVGTHRLFSNDLKFKNLDLLILDEEQKFGVKQKEKLKGLRENIHVLTLTATPIPRTLFMSLSGIRDISQINTPPIGRRSIETKVDLYSDNLVKDYIRREIGRDGQVYFLHNKVINIESRVRKLRKMFPKHSIFSAHGQMSERQLSDRMRDFTAGEIDVLVCSTIIENGLDLANVNTLIVEESDKFGLSQLYQIRGRIGRSSKQAYCLFTHRDKELTQTAFARLRSLVDHTDLGSGMNIAISDLEIRGGGNILGREQHGAMEQVGLVLYSKMLKIAVDKMKR